MDFQTEVAQHLIYLCENSAHEKNSFERIEKLFQNGADPNRTTIGGRTPLMIICWKNKKKNILDFINLLLEYGADPEKKDDFGWSALQFACRYNCTPQLPVIVQLLLDRSSGKIVNTTTLNCWNCLHQLCKYNTGGSLHLVIQILIGRGIQINAETNKKETALYLLCRYYRNVDFFSIFDLLVKEGAETNVTTVNGKTILHVLCKYSIDLDLCGIMTKLMEKNSCEDIVDFFDYYDTTAIVYAARLGCWQTVSLLARYSKLNVVDIFGQTVVQYLQEIYSKKSFPLCRCCRQSEMPATLLSQLTQDIEDKTLHYSSVPEIDIIALEKAIPQRIDFGFTNSNRDSEIRLPSGDMWTNIQNAWNSKEELDYKIFRQFLCDYTHQVNFCKYDSSACRWCFITNVIEKYVTELLHKVSTLDSRFEGHVIRYGSSAEDSKILEPDEFDFMIVLANFRESENCTVYFNGNESVNAFQTKSEVDRDGRIASAKILYYFYMLLAESVNRTNFVQIVFQNISFSETCVTIDCLYRGPLPGWFVDSAFKMSIDLTVGVARSKANSIQNLPWPIRSDYSITIQEKDEQYLVPHRQIAGSEISRWKPSFPTLERSVFKAFPNPVITECYCLLKLFIIIVSNLNQNQAVQKPKPSSYALKTCLFRYISKNMSNSWKESEMWNYCRGVCEEFLNESENLNSFFDCNLPVYVIDSESRQIIKQIYDKLEPVKKNCCTRFKCCIVG